MKEEHALFAIYRVTFYELRVPTAVQPITPSGNYWICSQYMYLGIIFRPLAYVNASNPRSGAGLEKQMARQE